MYESKAGRTAKASHYVSLSNGRVYPALRNCPGYEDDNPGDWRVASADEIALYKRGDQPKLQPHGEVVLSQAPAAPASPSVITLAEDDAAADPSDPPPAPAAAIAAVAPAFQIPAA